MHPTTGDWFIDGLEKSLVWAGARDLDHAMATFKKLLDKLQALYDEMPSKEELIRKLDALPEPGRLEKRFYLGLFSFLPQVFLYGVKRFAENAADEIPALPAGRPGLDAYLKAQLIAEVGGKQMRAYAFQGSPGKSALSSALTRSCAWRI